MAQYDNNLTGALFANDRKREGKKDPDYTGSAEIDGQHFWVDCWLKNPKRVNGQENPDYKPDKKTFFSLSFRYKEARQQQGRQQQPREQRQPTHRPPPPMRPAEPQQPDHDHQWAGDK